MVVTTSEEECGQRRKRQRVAAIRRLRARRYVRARICQGAQALAGPIVVALRRGPRSLQPLASRGRALDPNPMLLQRIVAATLSPAQTGRS